MKKFLQLDTKSCSLSLSYEQDQPLCLCIGWNLNFTYLVQNISLCINPKCYENLMLNKLRIYSAVNSMETREIVVVENIIAQEKENKPIFYQKIKLQKAGYLCNTLLVQIQIGEGNVEGFKKQEEMDVERELDIGIVKKLGFEGVEIEGYNTNIYQSMQDKSSLFTLYSQLLISTQTLQCNISYFHLGMIAKNSARLNQAQQIFKKLYKNQTSKSQIGELILVLNIIDCSNQLSTKLHYLSLLSLIPICSSSQSNLFHHCQLFIETLIYHSDSSNYILSTTIFNIFYYFANKIGCSLAPLYQPILVLMFSTLNNKTMIKNLKRESYPNYEVLVSCIQQFVEVIRQCLMFLSNYYIQKLTKLLLSQIFKPHIQPIQQVIVKILSYLVKQSEGGVQVKYDEWIRLVYLFEGQKMIQGMEIGHDMFHNKHLTGMNGLYQEYKKSILKNISNTNREIFLDSLNKHFTEIICNQGMNMVLVNHFLDVISLFCVGISENRLADSSVMMQFLQPYKALIYRVIQRSLLPQPQFTTLWSSFLLLFSILQPQIQDTLNNIIITLFNHFTKDGIPPTHILYIPVIISSYTSDNKYLQFWERLGRSVANMMPNSLYPDKVMNLLKSVIEVSPQILESVVIEVIVEKMVDPYTEYRGEWIGLMEGIRESEKFTEEVLGKILELIAHPYKAKTKSKISLSDNFKKQQVQRQTKKIYLIDKLLSHKPLSPALLHLLSSICTTLSLTILFFPQHLKSLMYHKYYYLRKPLSLSLIPPTLSHFTFLSLQYPPITFSFLICISFSRHQIPIQDYNEIFEKLICYVNQPWKNIQQLVIKLLVFFSRGDVGLMGRLVGELLKEGEAEVYKTMMALTVVYGLVGKKYEDGNATEIREMVEPYMSRLKQLSTLKQLDLLTRYTLSILNRKFNLEIQIGDYEINYQEQQLMLITFDYEKRIDSIVKKDMEKEIESVLKLDEGFGVPKKGVDRERDIDEVEDIEERIKEREMELEKGRDREKDREKDRFNEIEKQMQKRRQQKKQHQQYEQLKQKAQIKQQKIQAIEHISQVSSRQQYDHEEQLYNLSESPQKFQQEQIQQNFPSPARFDQSPKNKDSEQNSKSKSPASKIRKTPKSSSRKHSTPKSKLIQQFSSIHPPSKPSKPVKEMKKKKHEDSPIISIQSKNSVFKINLGQLNKTWRENLNMIGKKKENGKNEK